MGIDGRRDHSFRIPRPDLSVTTDAPNACTDCHSNQTPQWAASELEKRFPQSTNRGPHFAQVFALAWSDPKSEERELMAIARDETAAGIVRATALSILQNIPSPEIANQSAELLKDTEPLIRQSAVILQRGAEPQERTRRLVSLLSDPVRSVRIAAAKEMVGAPVQQLPKQFRTDLQKASEEFKASVVAKLDFPETHLVIGGTALTSRNWRAAEAAVKEAVELDPQQQDAWSMVVRIQEALGDRQTARQSLDRAIKFNPNSPLLQQLRQSLRL
ncbi:MAG: tetratricopeptide repeat protein [Rhizobiaceae bacterium]